MQKEEPCARMRVDGYFFTPRHYAPSRHARFWNRTAS
jgi:hypothetical protein